MALSIMLVLGMSLVALLQQHVSFMSLFRKQSFLTSEAPQTGNLVGRLFSKADHYFVYPSRAEALAGSAPVLVGGKAVRLFYTGVNGEILEHWISAETSGSETVLRCYSHRPNGTQTSWKICGGLAGASFRCDEGVLGVLLQGPGGEEISYYGESR